MLAPPRLEDIAAKVGVAVSTASRALAGSTAISAETRRAVQEAAADLGYRLPAQGRRVKKSATRMVGVVVGALHNRFMTQLLEHLHHALHEAGYQLTLIIDSMSEASALQTLRPLVDGYLDGLIIATATLDSPVVAELRRRGVPIVLVVRSVGQPGLDTIEIDNVHAGEVAVGHLHELGHRRIGLLMGPRNISTSRDRVVGTLRWLEAHGIAAGDVPLVWGEYTTESGYSCAMSMLAAHEDLTAIVAGNDTIAIGVLEAARRRGLSVPDQLSVIGFDDIPFAGSSLLSLTTIRQPVEAMARMAARRLVERIGAGAMTAAVHDLLPIHLIRRGTTGPCAAA
jgi:LacI family transcriptional regulator